MQVDLRNRQVSTVAGNGRKGGDYVGGRSGGNQQLNSPWDLAFGPQVQPPPVHHVRLYSRHNLQNFALISIMPLC